MRQTNRGKVVVGVGGNFVRISFCGSQVDLRSLGNRLVHWLFFESLLVHTICKGFCTREGRLGVFLLPMCMSNLHCLCIFEVPLLMLLVVLGHLVAIGMFGGFS